MRSFVIAVLFFTAVCVVSAQTQGKEAPSAEELLKLVDENEVYTTIKYEGSMVIEYQGKRFVKTMRSWARENKDSFVEFTNREDSGTKYLKNGGRLYVYSPDTEEVLLISGHMLKESMMGSDMSYEDTLENSTLSSRYTPSIEGSEVWQSPSGEIDCWILVLVEKKKNSQSYPKRKLWIDKATGDLRRYELYALSGSKLKEFTVLKVETIAGRRFATESEARDLLRKGSKTTFTMTKVELDKPIADSIFSMRNLER